MNPFTEFQTRSEETGIVSNKSLDAAMSHAKNDISVWKISFYLPNGERIRLVWNSSISSWIYEPLYEL